MEERKLGDRVAYDVKRYLDLRVDNAKLAAVEGLSSITGSAIALVICLFLATLALMLFTGVFVYLVNLVVNSWVWSAVIIGVIYLAAALFLLNNADIFRNRMVKLFAHMFFGRKNDMDDEEEDDE